MVLVRKHSPSYGLAFTFVDKYHLIQRRNSGICSRTYGGLGLSQDAKRTRPTTVSFLL